MLDRIIRGGSVLDGSGREAESVIEARCAALGCPLKRPDFALLGNIRPSLKGCRFDFGGRVALDLSFATDAGLHIRRNEKEQKYMATSLSIYNNGLIQSFYPQLTILFKLK